MRLALALSIALLLAGCAAEDGGAPSPSAATVSPAPSAAPTPAPTPAPTAAQVPTQTSGAGDTPHDVRVESFAFRPSTYTTLAGDEVTWLNMDGASHTATAEDGSFDVALDGGATGSAIVAANGTYAYFCKIHPGMRATLIVGTPEPPATPAPATPTDAPPTAPTPTPTPAPSPTPAPPAAEQKVDIHNSRFLPSALAVPAGTTVRWVNADGFAHSATADGGTFDTGFLSSGASGTATFATAGTFGYFCKAHPSMRGTITVT